VFGAIITVTGMLGMLSIMTSGSPTASQIGTASLLVPQGWAVRGLVQTMHGAPFMELGTTVLALVAWVSSSSPSACGVSTAGMHRRLL